MRKLVSVQEIKDIQPIPNADAIEVATILGWKLVIKKGEFKVGDKCVYFEVDSFLPVEDKYEFLRGTSYRVHELLGEGFRIKTMKLRNQISQGLALPLSMLGLSEDIELDTELTEQLNVRKWEYIEYVTTNGVAKEGLPNGVSKTDETRIQTYYDELMKEFKGKPYYIATKIDGSSVTMCNTESGFTVCTHTTTLVRDTENPSELYEFAEKLGVERAMKEKGYTHIVLQGEIAGPKICKNRLKLSKPEWFVFTAKDLSTGHRLGVHEMVAICEDIGVKTVPIEEYGEDLTVAYPTLESLLKRAEGLYPSGLPKEGIVIRPVEPVYSPTLGETLSFKVLNNNFLLKEK